MEVIATEGIVTINFGTRKRVKDMIVKNTLEFCELTNIVTDEKMSRALKNTIRAAVDSALTAILYTENNHEVQPLDNG